MPDRLIPRGVRARIGRRGLILFFVGLAWLIQGVALVVLGETSTLAGAETMFFHERLPWPMLGGVWAAAGVTSMWAGLQRDDKNDTFGFLAVSAPPMFYAGSYLTGAIARILIGDPLWLLGLLGFAIWGVITLVLGLIASWHDPVGGTDHD